MFAVGVSALAFASELRVGLAQGANIRSVTVAAGGKYSFQCPNIDGGGGQRIFYRPGCPTRTDAGISCVVDAGLGDVIVDFTSATGQQDPYKVDLSPNEDRIHFANADSYANSVYCVVYRRNP